MKCKCIILVLSLFCGSMATVKAQRAYVGTGSEAGLIIVKTAGLPAKSIKSAGEISASKEMRTGILKRHTEKSGNGGNPNVNEKVSLGFAVSPQDVPLSASFTRLDMNWMEASGWNVDANENSNATATPSSPATGCAAYKGPKGTDAPGTWRLPTQREIQLIWILHNQLKALSGFTALSVAYPNDSYWSATESSGTVAYELSAGNIYQTSKTDTDKKRVRCVRDL